MFYLDNILLYLVANRYFCTSSEDANLNYGAQSSFKQFLRCGIKSLKQNNNCY